MRPALIAIISLLLIGSGVAPAFGDRESTREGTPAQAARVRTGQPAVAARAAAAAKTETIGASRTQATKESGEKGGTEDINIGIGELEECTDAAPPTRARRRR